MPAASDVILAIDTATGPCSVAVWKDGGLASSLESSGHSLQSAQLFPMIEQALKESELTYADLTRVACTTGPGSFTGIRVGLAAARGICFAAGIPGCGFTTLETLAFAARESAKPLQPVMAILNAGKGEWYYQAFRKPGTPLFAPRLGSLENAQQAAPSSTLTVGPVRIKGLMASPVTAPRADALAGLAAATPANEDRPLTPFYIRPPDAKPQAKIL